MTLGNVSSCTSLTDKVRFGVTWPRWPSSQERAGGLLKRDILCVYQACRSSSFAVQKASRAQSPAASAARSWRTDIPQSRDGQTAATATGGGFKETRPPRQQHFHTNTDATTEGQLPPTQFISYISTFFFWFLVFNFQFQVWMCACCIIACFYFSYESL